MSTATGLPSNNVYFVAEDAVGFLWLATDIGVYRFDGSVYTEIQLHGQHQTPMEGIFSELYFDSTGLLWIGTARDGLFTYQPRSGRTTHYRHDHADSNSISSNRTYNFFSDPFGQVWFTAHGEGLCRYDAESDRFDRVRPLQEEAMLRKYKDYPHMITDACRDRDRPSVFWISSLHGLIRWDISANSFQYLNPPREDIGIRSIWQDKTGRIWCATWGLGFFVYNPASDTWSVFRCTAGEDGASTCLNVRDIYALDDSTLLLSSATGLLKFNTHSLVFDSSLLSQPPNNPHQIFEDSHGNVWICAPGEGLYILQKNKRHFPRVSLKAKINDVIVHPGDGSIYACTDDDLYHLSPQGEVLSRTRCSRYLEPREHRLVDLAFDANAHLWVLDLYGIYTFSEAGELHPFQHSGQQQLIDNGYYWKFFIDSSDICWIYAQSSGVWSLDLGSKALVQHDYRDGDRNSLIHNYSIAAGLIDSSGDIWGSGSTGVFYYEQAGSRFVNSPGPLLLEGRVPVGSVTAFAQDESGSIWLGRNVNALGKIDKAELQRAVIERIPGFVNLPQARISDMIFDQSGDLWIACEEGIVRYRPSLDTVSFFGAAFGFTGVSAIRQSSLGRLLAVADNGLILLNTSETPETNVQPKPVITAFNVFDRPYLDKDASRVPFIHEVELRYSQNFFSFEFGAIDLTNYEQKEFAYMLEGLDKDWNYPQVGRQYAAYTNVGGGRFLFRVKARNPGEAWGDEEARLVVSVTPPVWQRGWFIVSSLILIASAIWYGYSYRIREIKKKQALITEFNKQLAQSEMKALRAQMNPHFLFNTLNAIKLYVQKNEQELAVSFLTDFAKLIRLVLQNSSRALIPLSAELDALDLYIRIERMRFDASFDYLIRIDNSVSPDTLLIPPLLLQPYVENAIWHGLMHKHDSRGMLLVHISHDGKDVLCTVEDNGIGRDASRVIKSKSAEKNKSMGMQITKDRMDVTSRLTDQTFDVTITDLQDSQGSPAGCRVVLRISSKPQHQAPDR